MNIPSIIFIVPYKNRESDKNKFSKQMKYILEDLSSYEIYYSYQYNNKPFNRGAVKNIGFMAMKNKYPNDYRNITFVFNDIDTFPKIKNQLNYETIHGVIKHFYGYKHTLGGIFSIKGSDFEKCNGFPNYWGWGLEDNMLQLRVLSNGLHINRDNFISVKNNRDIFHLNNTFIKIMSTNSVNQYKKKLNFGLNSINNLNYKINNDYIIIYDFLTELNPFLDKYYNHDLRKSNRIIFPKTYQCINKRWKLNNFM